MGDSSERRLLSYREVAEQLNLSVQEVGWLVNTGQLRDVSICGKKRIDRRDVDRLVTFYKRVQQRSRNHAKQNLQVSGG